jgi:hypothetical protein
LLQENYTRNLYKIFPYNSPFWEYYEIFKNQTLWSFGKENDIKNYESIDNNLLIQIAKYKSAFAKSATAGLAVLTDTEDPFQESQDEFHCGLQLLDDLKDWREDYKSSKHSFILNLLFNEENVKDISRVPINEEQINTIGRYIFLSGFAIKILNRAKSHFENALSLSVDKNVPLWHGLLKRNIAKCSDLVNHYSRETDWIVKKRQQVSQIHSTSTPNEFKINILNDSRGIIKRGIKYIILEHQHDYPEMMHHLLLPDFNNSVNQVDVSSNLFQRMIVLDNLLDLNLFIQDDKLAKILTEDLKFILNSKNKFVKGGWSYFPEYPWIPPDADSLAQIIKLVIKSNNLEIIGSFIEDINLLVNDNRYDDGSFRTWILDHKDKGILQNKINECVKIYWGEYFGKDIEITINVLLALSMLDRSKYQDVISKGIEKIYSVQNDEGYWNSGWYSGKYYATNLVTKLINTFGNVNLKSLKKVKEYIQNEQNDDGGWGQNKSDSLNTTYALSSLQNLLVYEDCEDSVFKKGIEYLVTHQKSTGSWEAVKYICMPQAVVPFRSETITTSYVVGFLSKYFNTHKSE